MTVRFNLSMTGQTEVEGAVRKVATKLRQRRAMFDDIGGAMVASTQQRFLDKRGPDGGAWAPHAPATTRGRSRSTRDRHGKFLSKKKRAEQTHDILRKSSLLFDSLSHRPETERVYVGANRVYARIHQFGGMAGRGLKVRIPARPYLGISSADQDEIMAIVKEHLEP